MPRLPLSCNDRDTVSRAGQIFRGQATRIRAEAAGKRTGVWLALRWAGCLDAAATAAQLLVAEDAEARKAAVLAARAARGA
jgi:hypothetical protein